MGLELDSGNAGCIALGWHSSRADRGSELDLAMNRVPFTGPMGPSSLIACRAGAQSLDSRKFAEIVIETDP